jgi:hypothetical protein
VELNDNAMVEWATGVKLTECRDFGLKCNRIEDNRTGVDWGRNPSVDPEVALRENLIESSPERGVLTVSDIGELALGASGTLPPDRGLNRIVIDTSEDHYVTQNAAGGSLHAEGNQWLDLEIGTPETDELVIRTKCDNEIDPGNPAYTNRILADPPETSTITPCWPAEPDSSPATGGQSLGALAAGGPESAVAPEDGGGSQAGAGPVSRGEVGPESPVEFVSGISAVKPNPFRGSVEIVLAASAEDSREGQLTVYDVGGRRVRSLHRGIIPPGEMTVRWDGRDEHGHVVSTGVYFVRFRLGDQDHLERFVKVQR